MKTAKSMTNVASAIEKASKVVFAPKDVPSSHKRNKDNPSSKKTGIIKFHGCALTMDNSCYSSSICSGLTFLIECFVLLKEGQNVSRTPMNNMTIA